MDKSMNRANLISIFIIVEIIVSVIASIFVIPIIDSESVWSNIIVGLIIFTNVFIFLRVLIILYYKEVKSGVASSIIVKICAVLLAIFVIATAIIVFIGQIN